MKQKQTSRNSISSKILLDDRKVILIILLYFIHKTIYITRPYYILLEY